MSICIIPARGGSKRIPRKNIREFYGKPMIAWSIEVAKKSGLFDRVVVSTDDQEIAEIAKSYGAEVPFLRTPELADDFTGTIPVVADAIRRLRLLGHNDSEICCIYPTAPFITVHDLRDGFERLKTGHWSFIFSATTYSFPIFRSFQKRESGGLEMVFPEHFNTRSQDLVEAYHDAGQFYWGTAEAWLTETVIFGSNSTLVEIPRWRVQDIDNEEDWVSAEQIFMNLASKET
jgi:N-acylneuraminate cytidylyltransferase